MKALLNKLKTLCFRWYYRRMNRMAWEGTPLPEVRTSVLQLTFDECTLATRMYHGSRERPLIIYFHGGGWTIGDLDTHHPFCLHLAHQTQCTVMSVDYRLAPEHPFPTAHNDALAASRWIIDNLNALAPNNGEVVIAGDSAGGNLTLATAARLPDEPRLRGCLMIYPAIQHYHAAMRSYTEHAKSGPLTTSIMRWFTDTYLAGLAPADPSVELMFPGRRTTLAGFPRSLLITAEKDPLRDDGRRLANTLQRANVNVQHEHFDREAHGFPCSEGPTPGHERFMALTKTWIEAISER
ncbi:alpha/beta hydrolase [Luminiphilus sp.]|nr:alpha/beta hydrolase [Luminiphilus sp.]MDC0410913.1 alpha/beta hydrolase [Luminiphilus sp.]